MTHEFPKRRYRPRIGKPIDPADPPAEMPVIQPPDAPLADRPAAPEAGPSLYDVRRLQHMAHIITQRRLESLTLYEPLPSQEAFHASQAKSRLARGSNRAGKTLVACVEVARAITGQDPHDKWPKKDGRFFVVGKDGQHIGKVLYRKLFRAGSFKIIRDQNTRLWRAFRPWDPSDAARAHEAKPAPPLVPPRLVENISWESKKDDIARTVKLKTGWELVFYSSLGKPPQGVDVDGVHFDEEIVDRSWYPEMAARILDRKGRFLWSATPQNATEHLYFLHERAQNRDAEVAEFHLKLADNPHIGEAEKKEFAASLNEDQHLVRIEGEYAVEGYKVYPNFRMDPTHGVDAFPIPPDWCRYLAVDPGVQVCAVLFLAVPPPSDPVHGKHLYLFDELYITRCDAYLFGERLAGRIGDIRFEAFLIDHQGGRMTEAGSGKSSEEQYIEQLRARKIECRRTGAAFTWASDDVQGGIEAVRGLLRIRQDGTPRLKVLRGMCPNLEREMKFYHYKLDRGLLTDKPMQRYNHAVDCLRYLAAFEPDYVKPRAGRRRNPILDFLDKQKKKKGGREYVRLGPGS